MRKLIAVSILASFVAGCKKDGAGEDSGNCLPLPEKTITVALNNCGENAGTGNPHSICFEQLIDDSRCPANVVCVWAGVAVAKFSMNANGTQHRFSLSTLNSRAFPPTDTTIAGYRIKLVNVLPHPGSGAPGPVRAVLEVTR